YADHRDLHSFPTRRSSDLCFTEHFNKRGKVNNAAAYFYRVTEPGIPRYVLQVHIKYSAVVFFKIFYGIFSVTGIMADIEAHTHRSEEHTSELQSRENLVCR